MAAALQTEGALPHAKLRPLARLVRILTSPALLFAARSGREFQGSKWAFIWNKFSKFVLGFRLFSTLASLQVFSKDQVISLANLSRWAFLLTFAAVGMRTNIGELKRQGLRPFIVGALAELSVAVATLLLVLAADRLIGLG